jgi:hypothetical protein
MKTTVRAVLAGLSALVLAVFLALASGSLTPAHSESGPAAVNPDQRAYWRDKAVELRSRVAAAAIREQAATAAYSRMLTRRYPAGDAKLAIIDERDDAAKELADARAEVKTFKQDARSAGVPDSWIDPEGTPPPWWVDPDS